MNLFCALFLVCLCLTYTSAAAWSRTRAHNITQQATNNSAYLLLPSDDVSVFFDNNFVTKTSLASVSPGQSFQAFLGTDPAVKVNARNDKAKACRCSAKRREQSPATKTLRYFDSASTHQSSIHGWRYAATPASDEERRKALDLFSCWYCPLRCLSYRSRIFARFA